MFANWETIIFIANITVCGANCDGSIVWPRTETQRYFSNWAYGLYIDQQIASQFLVGSKEDLLNRGWLVPITFTKGPVRMRGKGKVRQ